MSIELELQKRSGGKCELCNATEHLSTYTVQPEVGGMGQHIWICNTCSTQIDDTSTMESNHWRCLNESMWSEVSAIKVIAWRMLNRLKSEGWPNDLLDMIYLEEDELEWAKATGEGLSEEDKIIHKDSNGVILQHGDSVVLIKDLNVKGGGFTAKRGTAVRNISLDHENAQYIEGKVNGQQIVIITEYVKKI